MGSQLKYVLAGAETLKADGNALFSKNQYAAAIEKYPMGCARVSHWRAVKSLVFLTS